MVNNVGFNGNYTGGFAKYSDFENIAKYTLGSTIVKPEENPLQGLGLMAGISAALSVPKVIDKVIEFKNKTVDISMLSDETQKLHQKALDAMEYAKVHPKRTSAAHVAEERMIRAEKAINAEKIKLGIIEQKNMFVDDLAKKKNFFTSGDWKKPGSYKNAWHNYSLNTLEESVNIAKQGGNLSDDTLKLYDKIIKYVTNSKNATTNAGKIGNLRNANKAFAKANYAAILETAATKSTGFWGKIPKLIGLTKLSAAISKTAIKSPTLTSILKFGKGSGPFLAIAAGIQLVTQIIPAFTQLGAGKGILQVGKSTIKTAASVGGWVAGSAGAAAIGTLICPGLGTVVGGVFGAIAGVVGGCLGSWAAGKAANVIAGKDELELVKEKEAKNIAQNASENPRIANELYISAMQKLNSEGIVSEDSKIIFGTLNKMA